MYLVPKRLHKPQFIMWLYIDMCCWAVAVTKCLSIGLRGTERQEKESHWKVNGEIAFMLLTCSQQAQCMIGPPLAPDRDSILPHRAVPCSTCSLISKCHSAVEQTHKSWVSFVT